jgi:hypothetical protein
MLLQWTAVHRVKANKQMRKLSIFEEFSASYLCAKVELASLNYKNVYRQFNRDIFFSFFVEIK